MFDGTLQLETRSVGTWFALIPFLPRSAHAWRRLCQTRGWGAREDHHNTRNIPSRDWLQLLSHPSASVGCLISLSLSPPLRGEAFSYCCFVFLSSCFSFFFVPLFRRNIVFWCWSCFLCRAAAALHSAFCRRGWVVGWGGGKENGGMRSAWRVKAVVPNQRLQINPRSYSLYFQKLKFNRHWRELARARNTITFASHRMVTDFKGQCILTQNAPYVFLTSQMSFLATLTTLKHESVAHSVLSLHLDSL